MSVVFFVLNSRENRISVSAPFPIFQAFIFYYWQSLCRHKSEANESTLCGFVSFVTQVCKEAKLSVVSVGGIRKHPARSRRKCIGETDVFFLLISALVCLGCFPLMLMRSSLLKESTDGKWNDVIHQHIRRSTNTR